MDPEILKGLINLGVIGPFVALFAWYIVQKDKEIKEMRDALIKKQDERIADTKQVIDKLMDLNDKWMSVLSDNTKSMERTRFALKSIQQTLEQEDGKSNTQSSSRQNRESEDSW